MKNIILLFALSTLPALSFADTFDPLGKYNLYAQSSAVSTPIAVTNPTLLQPSFGELSGQFGLGMLLGITGMGLGSLSLLAPNYFNPFFFVPLLSLTSSICGVYLAGNNESITGSLLTTSIGGLLGFSTILLIGTVARDIWWAVLFSMYLPGILVFEITGITLITIGAMIGFNLSRQYKEGMAPSVSVATYEVQYGAATKSDVVTTVNLTGFRF